MQFRILGALEVIGERGTVALGGVKPRAVLAYLLLHADEPVSAERLATALWGEDAPPSAVKTVHVHVSRLRKALADARLLTTTAAGYQLRLQTDDLDAHRFARLVGDGRRALAADDPAHAAATIGEALALWRGPALADLTFEPFAPTEIAHLEEQRLDALEDRIEADLRIGRHAALVSELLQLVARHPTRERLTGQLMLALYRCGRQAEALETYSQARAYQRRELGLEPGPALQALQAQILAQAPALELGGARPVAPPVPPVPTGPTAGPRRLARPARRSIVGRVAELAELHGALDAAADGRGSLYLLLGEAGIGKTRLAEEIADAAAERGHDVLWGGAWEAGGAAAYWPWTQIIRQLLEAHSPEEGLADLAAGAPHVAPIVPELGRRFGPTNDPVPSLDTETARFSAFDAIASYLRAAARRRPLMIVLDDLHAADVASVRLVEFLARGLHGAGILAVATCRTDVGRPDGDVARALADLARAARPLNLAGLSRDEVHELAQAGSAPPLPRRLIDRVHAVTEGNPLFVDEMMRLLSVQADSGDPGLAAGRLPMPAAVRETISRRFEPLAPGVLQALTVAAVIGSKFRLDVLAAALGRERPVALGQLDEVARAGLIREVAGTLAGYEFTHALVRETLYDRLGAHERAVIHGQVGEAIAEIHGAVPDAALPELAHHFLEAAPAGDVPRAVDYAARAGERALELMAYEQAIELFEHALRTLELSRADPAVRGPILLALGQAEMRAGRLDASRATLRRAGEDARSLGSPELLARAALASAPWGLATALADEEDLVPLVEEAIERLSPDDSALRAQLLARLAAARYWSTPAAYRESLAGEAIAVARRVGDPATLALVLSDAHRATWDPDSPERSLPWTSEIYAIAERLGNMELAMVGHSWRISLLLELGELKIVDREIATFQQAAARLHQQRAQAQGLVHRCARAIMVGRFDEAETLLGEAAAYAPLLAQDQLLSMRLGALAFVMREVQGRLDELEAAVRYFADSQPAMPVWRCGLLSVYLQAGRETELRREYDRIMAAGLEALPRDNLWLPALALLAEACAHLGDRAGAAGLQAMLEPYAGRNVVTPDVAYIGPVDRYLALLAVTQGDDELARERLASARELAERMGARPTSVRLAVDEAVWLAERDPRRAAELAGASLAAAEALGLAGVVGRARELLLASPPPAV
jgi:DNA-binding SARP family transcriptional activator